MREGQYAFFCFFEFAYANVNSPKTSRRKPLPSLHSAILLLPDRHEFLSSLIINVLQKSSLHRQMGGAAKGRLSWAGVMAGEYFFAKINRYLL